MLGTAKTDTNGTECAGYLSIVRSIGVGAYNQTCILVAEVHQLSEITADLGSLGLNLVPISSDEEMGFISAPFMPAPSVPYSAQKDVAFYPGLCDTYLNVRKGMFTVFFPGEGHAPAITKDGILKLIVKIRKPC